MRVARTIDARNVVPIALGLTLAAGVGDLATDVQVTFTLIYVFPIALGTWFRGRRFGVVLTLVATGFALATMVTSAAPRASPLTMAWNTAGSLGSMLLLVWTLDRLRGYVEREHRARAEAVKELRHAGRLSMIGTIAAGVAHEVGTPLAVIQGRAELLAREGAGPSEVAAAAEVIHQQAVRIGTIVRGMLDFGRRSTGARRKVGLDQIALTAIELLRALDHRRCVVEVEPVTERVDVMGNAAELEQVIFNLLHNAVQAMPAGGALRVRCYRSRGRLGSERDASLCCVAVEDEGVGIPPEDLPHVFEPFFTSRGDRGGAGLGLSISYGIVRDHDGRIDVESTLGKGSRFEVVLPAARGGSPPFGRR